MKNTQQKFYSIKCIFLFFFFFFLQRYGTSYFARIIGNIINMHNFQQQSSSSSSNHFIEHDISTRKLGPSSGIHPSFLNRPIYTFMLLCPGVATHRVKIVLKKNAKLFLEISSCLRGFAVKLC